MEDHLLTSFGTHQFATREIVFAGAACIKS